MADVEIRDASTQAITEASFTGNLLTPISLNPSGWGAMSVAIFKVIAAHAGLVSGTTDPAASLKVTGRRQLYVNTTDDTLFFHSGTAADAWVSVGGGSGGGTGVALAYLEAATIPVKPTVSKDTSDALTFTGSWSLTFPASASESVWAIVASYELDGTAEDLDAADVQGPFVITGSDGTDGTDGEGVPVGGTAAQLLAKATGTNYDTEWVDAPAGGGGTAQALSRFEANTTANTTAQALAVAYADILEIAATDVFANIGGFTVATVSGISTITIPNDGLFKVTARLKAVTAGSVRSQLYMRANVLRSSVVVDDSDSIMSGGYCRAIAGARSAVLAGTTTLLLETGDTITFQLAEEVDTSNTYTIGGADSVVEIVEIPSEAVGVRGSTGQGVPVGGTDAQVLAKASDTDYDTEWVDAAAGGGGSDDGVVDTLALALSGSALTATAGRTVGADVASAALTLPFALLAGATFTGAAQGITPTADAHMTRKDYVDTADALKASLAGAIFTGAVAGITPTANAHLATKAYVDGLVNPVITHVNYIALSPDNAFSEAEFLAGNSAMSMSLTVPTFTSPPNQFVGIAVPDVEGDITGITQGGISVFMAFERVSGVIAIDGVDHKAWRTRVDQNDNASGIVYVITQA